MGHRHVLWPAVNIRDGIEQIDSGVIGKAAVAISGTGLTVQFLTDFGSLIAICINIAVGLLGGYLVLLKIRNERSKP